MYIVVNNDAYAPVLCAQCEADLLLTYLCGAPEVEWLARPPVVVADGTVWETGEIRTALVLAGAGALAGNTGPLNTRALSKFDDLCARYPNLRELVRRGAVFDAGEMELIRGRVEENREP